MLPLALIGTFVSGVAACASSSPGTPVSHAYFEELGVVDAGRLSRTVDQVLVQRYDFSLAREDVQFATVYYETGWKDRNPFPDEEEMGTVEARTRVVIRGSRVSGGEFRVLVEGENRIRTDSRPTWHTAPLTVDFRDWMAEIESELSVQIGAR